MTFPSMWPARAHSEKDVEAMADGPVFNPAYAASDSHAIPDCYIPYDFYDVYDEGEKNKPLVRPIVLEALSHLTFKQVAIMSICVIAMTAFVGTFLIGLANVVFPGISIAKPHVHKSCVNNYCNLADKILIGTQATLKTSPDKAMVLMKLGDAYQDRTAEHTRFMDVNTVALMNEIAEITTILTSTSTMPSVDLSTALANATTNIQKLEVLLSAMMKLAALAGHPNFAGVHAVDGLPEQFKKVRDHFVAISKELTEYAIFLAGTDKRLLEVVQDLPDIQERYHSTSRGLQKRTLSAVTAAVLPKLIQYRTLKFNGTSVNSTAANPSVGATPSFDGLKLPLLAAGFERHSTAMKVPYNLLSPSEPATFLFGTFNTTLAINLTPTIASSIFICNATYYINAWLPDTAFASASTECKVYTFAQALAAGVGVKDRKWRWYPKEFDAYPAGNGMWKFSFGERNMSEVKWEVRNAEGRGLGSI